MGKGNGRRPLSKCRVHYEHSRPTSHSLTAAEKCLQPLRLQCHWRQSKEVSYHLWARHVYRRKLAADVGRADNNNDSVGTYSANNKNIALALTVQCSREQSYLPRHVPQNDDWLSIDCLVHRCTTQHSTVSIRVIRYQAVFLTGTDQTMIIARTKMNCDALSLFRPAPVCPVQGWCIFLAPNERIRPRGDFDPL